MGDYISRDQVHDIIAKAYSGYLTDETRDCLEEVDCEVADLPSAGAWIPVTKRLPKNDTWVLYSDECGVVGECHYWNGFNKFKFTDGDNEMTDIIAWMPRPEPYKADMRGET